MNNIGGRVTDVVVDPTQANTIYITAAGGGVWKSTDAGMTYTPAWPNDYPQAIGSLARGSDGTLWAGTGEANASGGGITYRGDGVYKSTNGGATWQNVGLANASMIGRIAVDPTNPNRVLVAATGDLYSTGGKRGLYRTTDGGTHWNRVLTPDLAAAPWTGAVDVAIDPTNPNRVYATLWDHHRNSYLRPYGGIGSGLWVSDNAMARKASNVTWERIGNSHVSGPLPTYDASGSGLDTSPTLGRMGIVIAPSDHTRLYLITGESLGNDKGFFVSDNGDRALSAGGPTFVTSGHAGGNPRFEWWFGRLYVDPVNKNHVFKTDVSLRRSSTAARVERRRAARDQHGMASDPNVPNRVYLGNDGGMYRSDANGDSGWIHGTNMPWLQEYHVAVSQTRPNRIAIGLQDNGSNRSWSNVNDAVTDPVAANWASYGGGDGHYVVVDSADDTFYYSCSQNAGCSGVHDLASTTTTLSVAAAVGATNVKLASVTGLVPRRDADDRLDRREPRNGHDHDRRHLGRNRHGRQLHTGAGLRARLRRHGREERRHRHAEPRLRLPRQRPTLHDRRPAGPGRVQLGDALHRLQQPLAVDESRFDLDADRGARPADRPRAAGRLDNEQPALRGPVPVGLDDRRHQGRPEHRLRGHRQRPPLEDDHARDLVAAVPEPVRAGTCALGDVRDRRPGRRRARVRVVRRLPGGLPLGERLRDDERRARAQAGRTSAATCRTRP